MTGDKQRLTYKTDEILLETILGDAPFGIISINPSGIITLINQQAVNYLDIEDDAGSLAGRKLLDAIEGLPELFSVIRDTLENKARPFFLDSIYFNGSHLAIRGKSFRGGFLITIQNITPIKETEARILSAMIEGQEEERRRISREIHDGIGPLLSAVRINLENIMARKEGISDKAVLHELNGIISILDETIRDIRDLSHNLIPGVLQDFGLVPALNNLIERLRKTGQMKILFSSNCQGRLEPDLELVLYRIAQELIINAVKHSGADVLHVQVMRHPEGVVMSIEDNGRGMPPDQQVTQGIGLKNITARVKALNGNLMIDSSPGRGCSVTVEFPD